MNALPFAISTLDSKRFGLKVIRGCVSESAHADVVVDSIRAFEPDLVIYRCNAGDVKQAQGLREHGYVPIHADTLVYYSRSLRTELPSIVCGVGVSSSMASADERTAIADIARQSFSGYRSHYLANPALDQSKVLEGYVEWAQAHLTDPDPRKDTWVVRVHGRVRGFATCLLNQDGSSVEIILNAVDPSHMGRGLYGSLLNAIMNYYKQQDVGSLLISTQIWNYVVQRAWTRAGLALELAVDTYHVNASQLGNDG